MLVYCLKHILVPWPIWNNLQNRIQNFSCQNTITQPPSARQLCEGVPATLSLVPSYSYKQTHLILAISCTKIPKILLSLSLSRISLGIVFLLLSLENLSPTKNFSPLFHHFYTSKTLGKWVSLYEMGQLLHSYYLFPFSIFFVNIIFYIKMHLLFIGSLYSCI